jgi:hypothetical protein
MRGKLMRFLRWTTMFASLAGIWVMRSSAPHSPVPPVGQTSYIVSSRVTLAQRATSLLEQTWQRFTKGVGIVKSVNGDKSGTQSKKTSNQ